MINQPLELQFDGRFMDHILNYLWSTIFSTAIAPWFLRWYCLRCFPCCCFCYFDGISVSLYLIARLFQWRNSATQTSANTSAEHLTNKFNMLCCLQFERHILFEFSVNSSCNLLAELKNVLRACSVLCFIGELLTQLIDCPRLCSIFIDTIDLPRRRSPFSWSPFPPLSASSSISRGLAKWLAQD